MEDFLDWIIDLDNLDPNSEGFQNRRTVTLDQIIEKAKETKQTINDW